MIRRIVITLLLTVAYVHSIAQIDKLKSEIDSLIRDKKATVGVSIIANNYKKSGTIIQNNS